MAPQWLQNRATGERAPPQDGHVRPPGACAAGGGAVGGAACGVAGTWGGGAYWGGCPYPGGGAYWAGGYA